MDFYITARPEYPSIVQRIQSGETFLDAGCCFGYIPPATRVRRRAESNLFGTDLRQEFIDLGYELFKDEDSFGAKFIAGNILDPDDKGLDVFNGKLDIIHAASFFHLFSWDDQVKVGERLIQFFKPDAKEPTLLGRQVGNHSPPPRTGEQGEGSRRYHHNVDSFQALWDVIGKNTGTTWKVTGEVSDESRGPDDGRIILKFVVTEAK